MPYHQVDAKTPTLKCHTAYLIDLSHFIQCILQILFSHKWIFIRKKDATVTEKKVKVTVLLPLTVVVLTASGAAGEGEVTAVNPFTISVVLRPGAMSMQNAVLLV